MVERGGTTFDGQLRPSADRVSVIQSDVLVWTIIDGVLLVMIVCGNTLTILAVRYSRRLRSVISNLFILSLAISDMIVGFTLPYHLAFYMGSGLGTNKSFCLLRFFLIIMACCVSIWNLIAIAVDRYIAIVYPLHYSRCMTKKVVLVVLCIGWLVGISIAGIPMFWNNWDTARECEFDEVLPPWYMVGVITPIFSMVWFCLLTVYWRIWREASKHAKQLRSSYTGSHEGPSDWKSVQVVLLILGCFSICWLPYFIVACAQIFRFLENSSPTIYKAAFSLAMANSGMNPLIYAWKNSNFRRAFGRLLKCKAPDSVDLIHSMRSNLHRKSSSIHHQDTLNGSLPNYSTPPPLQRPPSNGSANGYGVGGHPTTFADTTISIMNGGCGSPQIILNDTATVIDDHDDVIAANNNNNNNNNSNSNNLNNNNNNSNKSTNNNLDYSCSVVKYDIQKSSKLLNNEITMGNIIINKCAIIENLENLQNNNNKSNNNNKNYLSNLNNDSNNVEIIKKPIESVINEKNDTIIYRINLINNDK